MLAIEVATATSSNAPLTFVFDEVDAGVGGRAALAVGARLAAHRKQCEHMPLPMLLQIAQQTAAVLVHAHAQNIVHRDLKPDNVMLVPDPVAPSGERVKLLDFGIAKLLDEGPKGNHHTATQAMMGSALYMSPEQVKGAGHVDTKTDVYALGCVLYQMLAGSTPFVGEGFGEIVAMHVFSEPRPIKELAPQTPDSVAVLVHKLLCKEKDRRPSMQEVADELGTLLARLSLSVPVLRLPAELITQVSRDACVPLHTTVGRSAAQKLRGVTHHKRTGFFVAFGVTVGIGVAFFPPWRFLPKPKPVSGSVPFKAPPEARPSPPPIHIEPPAPKRAEVPNATTSLQTTALPATPEPQPVPPVSLPPVSTDSGQEKKVDPPRGPKRPRPKETKTDSAKTSKPDGSASSTPAGGTKDDLSKRSEPPNPKPSSSTQSGPRKRVVYVE
jgi:serine/threonine protein kinase